MLLKSGQLGPGDVHANAIKTSAYNRTNAAVKRGEVAMCDVSATQGETTSTDFIPGSATAFWGNMGPVTQVGIDAGFPVYVAAEDIADNALGNWYVYGQVEVAALDDDAGTTDFDKGKPIMCLVSEADSSGSATGANAGGALTVGGGAVQGWATTTGLRILGLALEDAAADETVTARKIDFAAHYRWCFWTGGLPCFGKSDT